MPKRKAATRGRAAQAKKPKAETKEEAVENDETVESSTSSPSKLSGKKAAVKVLHCGACSWLKKKFQKLQGELEQLFPDQLEISAEKTKGRTGHFEVSVNGELIHSKKGGDGHYDKGDNYEKILSAIRQALGQQNGENDEKNGKEEEEK